MVVATAEAVGLRFSHAVVADALAAEVNPARRADVHAAAARSLARRRPDDEHAALVAHHAIRGAAAGSAPLAVSAGTRAARASMARSAPADAARSWAIVVEALEQSRPEDAAARLDALVEMGRAHERADEMVGAQRAAMEAMRLAMQVGDGERLGAAASVLGHASIFPNRAYGEIDLALVSVLGEALASLPEEDSPARVYVLAALATELVHSPDVERRDHASREALDQARRLGRPALVVRALHARTFTLKRPVDVETRRAVALEMAELAEAERLGDDLVLLAHLQIALADLALGDLDSVEAGLSRCLALTDRPVEALRAQVTYFRSLVELIRGRYGPAVVHADEAHDLFARGRPAEAASIRVAQRLTIAHDLGGIDEALSRISWPEAAGYARAIRLYLAVVMFDLDRREEAESLVAHPRGTLLDRPLDYLTTFLDVAAAIIAAETEDTVAAAGLLDRLSPFAGRWANAGTGAGSLGLVDLTLARLHATVGDEVAARHWFEAAVVGHEHVGAPAWLARSLLHQGRFLRSRGEPVAAADALRRAGAIAEAFSLPIVAQQVATTLRTDPPDG